MAVSWWTLATPPLTLCLPCPTYREVSGAHFPSKGGGSLEVPKTWTSPRAGVFTQPSLAVDGREAHRQGARWALAPAASSVSWVGAPLGFPCLLCGQGAQGSKLEEALAALVLVCCSAGEGPGAPTGSSPSQFNWVPR